MGVVLKPIRGAAMLGASLLAIALGMPAPASAACADNVKCGKNQTVARVETKECKANKKRPAITIRRACCQDKKGKIKCKPFKKCPKKSPSGSCS